MHIINRNDSFELSLKKTKVKQVDNKNKSLQDKIRYGSLETILYAIYHKD